MALPVFDLALLAFYVLLLGVVGIAYRRGRLPAERLPLVGGMCAVWLAYGLHQLSSAGPVATGTPLDHALDGAAVVLLVAGVAGLVRWWSRR